MWGLSLVWIPLCCVKEKLQWKAFPHSSRPKGFLPLWVMLGWMKTEWWLTVFLHSLHLQGFLPVWICWWCMRCDLQLKTFPRSMHLQGFSPAWILMCRAKSTFSRVAFLRLPSSVNLPTSNKEGGNSCWMLSYILCVCKGSVQQELLSLLALVWPSHE